MAQIKLEVGKRYLIKRRHSSLVSIIVLEESETSLRLKWEASEHETWESKSDFYESYRSYDIVEELKLLPESVNPSTETAK